VWRHHFILCLLVGLAPDLARAEFPYEGVVNVESGSLQVRAGPTENHYRTGVLKRGDRVVVVRGEPDGWLAIEPPEGSFSWICAGEGATVYVREISPSEGEVVRDDVNVRVGTPMSENLRDYVQVKLKRGARVKIIDRKTTGDGPLAKLWYKIEPPPGEVRYVMGQYIAAADGRRTPVNPPPSARTSAQSHPASRGSHAADRMSPGSRDSVAAHRWQATSEPNDPHEQADADDEHVESGSPADPVQHAHAAYSEEMRKRPSERDWPTVRRLYEQAARSTDHESDRAIIQQRLAAIDRQEQRRARLAEVERLTQQARERDRVLLSSTRLKDEPESAASPRSTLPPRSTAVPRFDGSGVLRKSATAIDGKPAYVLISPQGGIRYYITAAPGVDLSEHLDQAIAVRGTVNHRADLRAPHIMVRKVMPIGLH
jgi:hypothetical protein